MSVAQWLGESRRAEPWVRGGKDEARSFEVDSYHGCQERRAKEIARSRVGGDEDQRCWRVFRLTFSGLCADASLLA